MNCNEDKSSTTSKKKRFRPRKNPKQRKYRKKKQRKGQVPMPHRTYNNKPSISYGQSFWNNYRKAMEWQNNYMEGFWRQQAQRLQQENLRLKQRLSRSFVVPVNEIDDVEYSDHNSEGTTSDSHSDYEVSEEFMKFIEISLKHKEAMSKQKKENVKKTVKEEPSCKTDPTETSEDDPMCEAPVEDNAKKRMEEMKELYGSSSAKIHGMETAMHLGFMRKCDKNKPVIWPVVPLSNSFTFDLKNATSI